MNTIIKRDQPPSDVHFSLFLDDLKPEVFAGNGTSGPANRPYHQIVLLSKGTAYCRIDLENYRISDNTACLIPPDRYFRFIPKGPVSGAILSFDATFLNFALQGSGCAFIAETEAAMKMVNVIEMGPGFALLENLCRDIRSELQTPDILQLESVSGLFKRILVQLKRSARHTTQETPSSPKMRLFHQFAQSLDKQFKTKRGVSEYAAELSVTANYLNEAVRTVSGRPASYHIQQRVVQEAKRLAIYTDANMKMVAHSLGFLDSAHFSKFFRKVAGVNFSEFKKKAFVSSYDTVTETMTQAPVNE